MKNPLLEYEKDALNDFTAMIKELSDMNIACWVKLRNNTSIPVSFHYGNPEEGTVDCFLNISSQQAWQLNGKSLKNELLDIAEVVDPSLFILKKPST